MRRHALMLLTLTGCAAGAPVYQLVQCQSDVECDGLQVCFSTGCGDPGQGLVVEVTGNNQTLHPQDIPVSSLGGLKTEMNLELRGPLTIAGTLRQDLPERAGTIDFTRGVTVSARGESQLIPGLFRNYTKVFPQIEAGVYEMFVGAGKFTVVARPADAAIPYQIVRDVEVAPGRVGGGAPFTFPAIDGTLYLNGLLVARTEAGHPPKVIFQPGMTIQAFETAGGQPLSQVAKVSSQGVFTLAIDYSAANLGSIALVAAPIDNTAFAPTKTFVLSPVPTTSNLETLELGDFGDALPQVPGRLLTAAGAPIANATIQLEGKVGGGGSFTSRSVLTDSEGNFTVDVLPSPAASPYTLTAIPPPESGSGIAQILVYAGLLEGVPAFKGSYDSMVARVSFTCPDRLVATGSVTDPNGLPAASVTVIATAIEALDGRPVPTRAASVVTNAEGVFELLLDPARYRFDYVPSVKLPRRSRTIRIEHEIDVDAGNLRTSLDVGNFQLSLGRPVGGNVTVRQNTLDQPDGGSSNVGGGVAAANAVVRFYRVTAVEGISSSVLIGEGITDNNGRYSVILPDHPMNTSPAGP